MMNYQENVVSVISGELCVSVWEKQQGKGEEKLSCNFTGTSSSAIALASS